MIGLILSPNFPAMAGWFLALICPLAGLVALWYCNRRKPRYSQILLPLLWSLTLFGPFIVGLWFVFNAIENRFGLDSVLALVINLVLFCALGLGIGFAVRVAVNKSKAK